MEKNYKQELPPVLKRLRLHRILTIACFFLSLTLSLMGAHLVLIQEKSNSIPQKETLTIATFVEELDEDVQEPDFQEVEPKFHTHSQEKGEFLYFDVPLSMELQEYTQVLCEEMDVYYPLVLAVMAQESGYSPSAVSPENYNGSRDFGLMQINSKNHQWLESVLGVSDWLDPRQSILAGIYILSLYNDWNEDYQTIAMLYNTGPTGGKPYLESGTFTPYSYQVTEKLEEILRNSQENTAERVCVS